MVFGACACATARPPPETSGARMQTRAATSPNSLKQLLSDWSARFQTKPVRNHQSETQNFNICCMHIKTSYFSPKPVRNSPKPVRKQNSMFFCSHIFLRSEVQPCHQSESPKPVRNQSGKSLRGARFGPRGPPSKKLLHGISPFDPWTPVRNQSETSPKTSPKTGPESPSRQPPLGCLLFVHAGAGQGLMSWRWFRM